MLMIIIAGLCGLIFGLGLLISGMSNPQKVLNFLDITGNWDPSLLFVLSGALLAAFLPFHWAKKQSKSLLHEPMRLPQNLSIDKPLVIGSILFGIGWGLSGICPGPSLVLVGLMQTHAYYFLIAMLVGMWLFGLHQKRK